MIKPRTPRSTKNIDAVIGNRIREIRIDKDLTQAALAEAIGLSFQQIQKYERAKNRISASTLYAICQFLDYPIEKMFAERQLVHARKRARKR